MKPSRLSQVWRKRSRKRGFTGFGPVEEMFSTATLLACFVAPLAAGAAAVGPELAEGMSQQIQATSADDPGAGGSGSGLGNFDFGMFQSMAGTAMDIGQSVAEQWAAQREREREADKTGGQP